MFASALEDLIGVGVENGLVDNKHGASLAKTVVVVEDLMFREQVADR